MSANLSEPDEPPTDQRRSGPELLLDLGGVRTRVAVESALRTAVLEGRLLPGRRAAERALRTAVRTDLGYPDPRGHPALREELVAYLARARGMRTSVDRVVVCSGYVQILDLLARALAARGARTDELGEHDAVLLTSAHQFPLGVALGPGRRAAVLGWARRRGSRVVEDDDDGELRDDRAPVGALRALAEDLVAYAGTTSKALAPAVGLAWVALPSHRPRSSSVAAARPARTGVRRPRCSATSWRKVDHQPSPRMAHGDEPPGASVEGERPEPRGSSMSDPRRLSETYFRAWKTEQDELVGRDPDVFAPAWRTGQHGWTSVRPAGVATAELHALLDAAYDRTAG